MNKTYKVGIIGLVHDHVWSSINDFKNSGRAEIAAAADPNQPLLDKVSSEYGVSRLFTDYNEMLDSVDIDIALVCVENNRGAEVVKACASKGINVISEKPMAATLAQADEMLKASEDAGIKLLINWPSAWSAQLAHAVALIKQGEIGDLYKIRNLSSHGGPKEIGCSPYFYNWLYDEEKNGGGALMDYCCYGAVLCRLLLGMPKRITGVAGRYVKDYIDVDDNAVLLLDYGNALGICEASWTQIGHGYGQYFYGSKANLFIHDWRFMKYDKEHPEGCEIQAPKLPEHMKNGAEYLMHCLDTGAEIEGLCSPEISRDAQELLERGKNDAYPSFRASLK